MNKEGKDNIEPELLEQQYYIDKLRQENEYHYALTGNRKKYITETWGCPHVTLRMTKKHREINPYAQRHVSVHSQIL